VTPGWEAPRSAATRAHNSEDRTRASIVVASGHQLAVGRSDCTDEVGCILAADSLRGRKCCQASGSEHAGHSVDERIGGRG
jgi:hypothetical protein